MLVEYNEENVDQQSENCGQRMNAQEDKVAI